MGKRTIQKSNPRQDFYCKCKVPDIKEKTFKFPGIQRLATMQRCGSCEKFLQWIKK